MKSGYYSYAGLADESVTIFTTFSRRIQKNPELWERRKAWLRSQTWPKIRLVVANTSHEPLPAGWLDGLPAIDISSYTHAVGTTGLEDANRREGQTEVDVQTAVAAIYNRMWQETRDEFVLVLEDDVFPKRLDTIDALMKACDTNVCAVSGAYQQRYHPYAWTSWLNTPPDGRPKLIEAKAEPSQPKSPRKGVQPVTGTGFGCVLLRRSQVAHEVITGNTLISRYYDTDLFERLHRQGKQVRLNWDVWCEHAGQIMPPPINPQPVTSAWPLGDQVESVLSTIGINKERVSRWLGKPCECPARQEKLNRLGDWAASVAKGIFGKSEAESAINKLLA
jgi:hypothetical protein